MKLGDIHGPESGSYVLCSYCGQAYHGCTACYWEEYNGEEKRNWCSNGCLKKWIKRKLLKRASEIGTLSGLYHQHKE